MKYGFFLHIYIKHSIYIHKDNIIVILTNNNPGGPSMPFVKGDPNINRKGAPKKGNTLSDTLKNVMESRREIVLKDGTKITKKTQDMLIERWIEFALIDYQALVKLMEHTHGRPDVYKVVDATITMPKVTLTSEITEGDKE